MRSSDDRRRSQIFIVGLRASKAWVKNGFLNENLKVPARLCSARYAPRSRLDLLLQNLMLVADAMGLGAWIHATISPPVDDGAIRNSKKVVRQDARLRFRHPAMCWLLGFCCAGNARCRNMPICARIPSV